VKPGDPLPPLPKNFKATDGEPSVLQKSRRKSWTEQQWREYRGIYFRLVEAADAQIGRIMEALDRSGHAANTVVIFTSDHGEMNGAHCQTTKVKFYEEAAAVPLIEGKAIAWRDCVFSEMTAGRTPARMARNARYKYVVYAGGEDREQFFDLDADPHEMNNLAAAAPHAKALGEHQRRLKQWCEQTNDTFKAT
jgi:arylsulfatase A-like enzyme